MGSVKRFLNDRRHVPYILLTPFILFFLIFRLWPIIWSFAISFFNYSGVEAEFIGLQNYISLFQNSTFRTSIWNTIFFVIVYNIIMLFLAILLAVIVSSKGIHGRKFFRSVYFIPIAMTLPVVSIVFDMLFANNVGLVRAICDLLGKEYELRWFADVNLAMWGIIIMRIWRNAGYFCAYFLAGLTGISDEYYEAAAIDGSGPIKTFFKITLPLLKPTLLYVMVMSMIQSFQLFDEAWILTKGGPANRTLTMQIFLYKTSFLEGEISEGAAVAYVMTILMMALSIIYVRGLSEKEVSRG